MDDDQYVWRDRLKNLPGVFTLRFQRPLLISDVFVDLCSGERYKVEYVSEQPQKSITTSPLRKCSEKELSDFREKTPSVVVKKDCKSNMEFVLEGDLKIGTRE
jgi:hypothetical protein